jgi:CheY-like chemotaxis protein
MFHGSIRGRQVTGTSIIVVEDERIVALHLKQQLSKLGYNVAAVVASSNEALHKISEVRPDLVLMDIHIEGDIDGIETTMRIPAEYRIPVIYLSAYSEEATLERARSSKPYGFLSSRSPSENCTFPSRWLWNEAGWIRRCRAARNRHSASGTPPNAISTWPASWYWRSMSRVM